VFDSISGEKPVLTDSSNDGSRCLLQEVPQSHAQMPIFGFQLAQNLLVGKFSARSVHVLSCFFLPCGKKDRVLEAVRQRKSELTFLKGLSWWPKWASPDSLLVLISLIVPSISCMMPYSL
jgi:hypothetical protein